jgi:hypothetical protein
MRSVLFNRALRFLLVACAMQVPDATAAAWSHVTSTSDGLIDFYVDKSSIKGGHERTGRVLYDYRNVQQDPDTLEEHRSTVVSARVDCVAPRLGVIRSANYADAMGRGKAIDLASTATPEMHAVSSGTIDDQIRAAICAKRGSR